MLCTCGHKKQLEFSINKLNEPMFNWNCSYCNKITPHEPQIEIDFANDDFKPIIDSLTNKTIAERETVISEIKSQMVNILKHFIECDKGWHYNTLFKSLLKPYLDNPLVLDFVLKSKAIRGNEINGNSGAKIYPELLRRLEQVDSPKIKNYLKTEFKTTAI